MPTNSKRVKRTFCTVAGCEKPELARGLCQRHYHRNYDRIRNGRRPGVDQRRGLLEPTPGPDGYIRVYHNGRQVGQHRLVMERQLDRPLLSHESVHHKNGQRADNRPSNLELWSTSQPSGQRVIDKIEWAKEFLETYGFTVTR